MSKQKQPTPYEQHRANIDRILAELDKELAGWTPSSKEG